MAVEQVLGDPVIYIIFGVVFGILAAAIVFLRRPPPPPPPPQTSQQEKEKEQVSLDEILGLDQALAAKAYLALKEGLSKGLVRIELVSDACPGRVFLDVASQEWMCSAKGRVWPLARGPRPAEILEVEDRETRKVVEAAEKARGAGKDGG